MLKESGETIYLGYSKGDYDRSRPGRVVKDDPSRCECLPRTRGLQPDGCAAACWTSGLQALCLSLIAFGAGVRPCLSSGTLLGVPCAEIRAAVCGLACPGVIHHCTGLPCLGMTISGLSADPEKSTTTGGWAGGEKGLLSFIQVSAAASCASHCLCPAC